MTVELGLGCRVDSEVVVDLAGAERGLYAGG